MMNFESKIKEEPIDAGYYENKCRSAKVIIDREFNREVNERQEQVIFIQQQIHEAQKSLKILEYVASCDYYNLKQDFKSEVKSATEMAIHPCVKKLLSNQIRTGSRPSTRSNSPSSQCNNDSEDGIIDVDETDGCLQPTKIRLEQNANLNDHTNNDKINPLPSCSKNCNDYSTTNVNNIAPQSIEKEQNHERTIALKNESCVSGAKKSISETAIVSTTNGAPRLKRLELKSNVTIIRGTYRVCHQLVVGNVSKSIPIPLREDENTHKWMIYIRLKDKKQNLGTIIKKVRYYLHDSYKPNNIIDVTTPPFHLTRRGWGDFPVRVTLYFQHPSNKPTDIIHQLKLDSTHSGQQMLGGETVAELNLFHDDVDDLLQEETVIQPSTLDCRSELEKIVAIEHDYSLPPGSAQTSVEMSQKGLADSAANPQPIVGEETSELSLLKTWDYKTHGPLKKWYMDNVQCRAESICFFTTEACVKWLFQKWPLVTANASITVYRRAHPYSFTSIDEYYRANIGKKRASEYYLAWRIKSVLESLKLAIWTMRQIIMYARMHGYVHVHNRVRHFEQPAAYFKNVSTYTNSIDRVSNLRQLEMVHSQVIDILSDPAPSDQASSTKNFKTVTIVSALIKYVDIKSREIGIKLANEEMVEGVTINAPAAVLATAVKMFLEDLLRKSCCNAWLRNKHLNPGSLDVVDIVKYLMETPQMTIFTNAGLGSKLNEL